VEVIYERCAGLDIGKDEVVACIRVPDGAGGRHQEVHTFKTFSADREALADWLTEHGVTQADGALRSSSEVLAEIPHPSGGSVADQSMAITSRRPWVGGVGRPGA
jgi:hypothetical protein